MGPGSDPVTGSPATKAKKRKEKAKAKRAKTIAAKKTQAEQLAAEAALQAEQEAAQVALLQAQLKETLAETQRLYATAAAAEDAQVAYERNAQRASQDALHALEEYGFSWGEFILFMSRRRTEHRRERYLGFFARPTLVEQVLDTWASSRNSLNGRRVVSDWAMKYIGRVVNNEASAVIMTSQGVLRTANARKNLIKKFTTDFDYTNLCVNLAHSCPTMVHVMKSFSTTTRQTNHGSERSIAKKFTRLGASLLSLLGERSQQNNYSKSVFSLALYASGAQRQIIALLSAIGFCGSYTGLVGSKPLQEGSRDPTSISLIPAAQASDTGHSDAMIDSDSEFHPSSEALLEGSSELEVSGSESDYGSEESGSELGDEGDSSSSSEGDSETEADRLRSDLKGVELEYVTRRQQEKLSKLGVRLAINQRKRVRKLARTFELGHVYDNYNIYYKTAEQIIGRKDTQENGTCATVFPLYNATKENMRTEDLIKSLGGAPDLSVDDILLTQDENKMLDEYLLHTILRIIVLHGGPSFQRFRDTVMKNVPATSEKIPPHKTDVFPLPAMNIDESSTTGNADVLDTIYRELGHHFDSPLFSETVRVVFGDQLSVKAQRAVTGNRIGHDDPLRTHVNTVQAPGFFHYLMAAAAGTLETHFGDPHSGARDPASLCNHNTLLDRKPIVTSSMPPYRVSRDLIFISLYARILHCLELVTNCNSLDEYAKTTTFEKLKEDAKQILKRFANPQIVSQLRRERAMHERSTNDQASHPSSQPSGQSAAASSQDEPSASESGTSESNCARTRESTSSTQFAPNSSGGDMVFENAVLFNRDALQLFAFNMVIREESMTQLHNLLHIWPKPLRDIIIQNWVINPIGKPNSFVPVDLVQEHFILWIKIIYSAQGSNASPEWLEKISPCIAVLREIATQLNEALGSKQGNKHQTPQIDNDIRELMKSLRMHRVYSVERGRTIDGKKAQIPNVQSAGFNKLGSPLRSYNAEFERRKQRLRMTPLIGNPLLSRHMDSDTAMDGSESENDTESDVGSNASGDDEPANEPDDAEEEESELVFSLETEDDVLTNVGPSPFASSRARPVKGKLASDWPRESSEDGQALYYSSWWASWNSAGLGGPYHSKVERWSKEEDLSTSSCTREVVVFADIFSLCYLLS
ncbi:hypothetical protein K474DRAFT_1700685 [Panus rudis PR-1116 ss-1]|nr:hypothetical protein K474DRAFT_1700685 [Panus rudis PR-1116 ss-1]